MTQSHRTLSWQPYLFVTKYLRSESLRSSPGRIVPIGNLKTNPSNNNMGKLCFAFISVTKFLGGGGCGILLHRCCNHEKFRWVGLSWESGLVCRVALGTAVCPLAPTSLGCAYTMNLGKVWDAEDSRDARGRRTISGAVSRHWRDSPLEWLQWLPWQLLRRMLKATRSTTENVLLFFTSHYIWHNWPDSFFRLFLPWLLWHESSCFCSLPWVTLSPSFADTCFPPSSFTH